MKKLDAFSIVLEALRILGTNQIAGIVLAAGLAVALVIRVAKGNDRDDTKKPKQ